MNKKIVNQIAIAIILIIAIVFGVLLWLNSKQLGNQTQPTTTSPAAQKPETHQLETTPANETAPDSLQNTESGFQQNEKTIKGYGIEATFEDGILSINDANIVFNPKDRKVFKEGESQVGVPEDIYEMSVSDYRTADIIIKEAIQSPTNTKKPTQKKINGFTVIEYTDGGFCDTRFTEVIGKIHNYIFSSLGCYHDESVDFASFEKVISTMRLLNETENLICGNVDKFNNEPWSRDLNIHYGCFIKSKNIIVFIPESFEFGCGRILKYDILEKKLTESPVQPPDLCADEIKNITDNYIEFRGSTGDAGDGISYYGKYYFNENKAQLEKQCQLRNSKEVNCKQVNKTY